MSEITLQLWLSVGLDWVGYTSRFYVTRRFRTDSGATHQIQDFRLQNVHCDSGVLILGLKSILGKWSGSNVVRYTLNYEENSGTHTHYELFLL